MRPRVAAQEKLMQVWANALWVISCLLSILWGMEQTDLRWVNGFTLSQVYSTFGWASFKNDIAKWRAHWDSTITFNPTRNPFGGQSFPNKVSFAQSTLARPWPVCCLHALDFPNSTSYVCDEFHRVTHMLVCTTAGVIGTWQLLTGSWRNDWTKMNWPGAITFYIKNWVFMCIIYTYMCNRHAYMQIRRTTNCGDQLCICISTGITFSCKCSGVLRWLPSLCSWPQPP